MTDNSNRKNKAKNKIEALLKERDGLLPVWIRAPKSGTEHYTGLSRAKLYELTGQGAIRAISLKEPGMIKGTRLFELKSILFYLETFASTQESNQ